MRRIDREIIDKSRIEEFIAKEQILRIAFYDEGDIYIVPVNYGYLFAEQYTFYFHGAKAGRKYELAKKTPSVGFEIDGNYSLLESELACDFSATFQSVVGTGKLSLIENDNEKIKGLNAIMKQTTSKDEWNYSNEMLETVAVFRLDVAKLSCKAKQYNASEALKFHMYSMSSFLSTFGKHIGETIDTETIDEVELFSYVLKQKAYKEELNQYYENFDDEKEKRAAQIRFEIARLENKNRKRENVIANLYTENGKRPLKNKKRQYLENNEINLEKDKRKIERLLDELAML